MTPGRSRAAHGASRSCCARLRPGAGSRPPAPNRTYVSATAAEDTASQPPLLAPIVAAVAAFRRPAGQPVGGHLRHPRWPVSCSRPRLTRASPAGRSSGRRSARSSSTGLAHVYADVIGEQVQDPQAGRAGRIDPARRRGRLGTAAGIADPGAGLRDRAAGPRFGEHLRAQRALADGRAARRLGRRGRFSQRRAGHGAGYRVAGVRRARGAGRCC